MAWLDTFVGRERALRSPQPLSPTVFNSAGEAASFCLNWLIGSTRADAGHAYVLSSADGAYRLAAMVGDAAPTLLDPGDVPPRAAISDRAGERWLTVPCPPGLILRVRLRRGATLTPELQAQCEPFAQGAGAMTETARRLADVGQEAEQLKTLLNTSRMAGEVALRPHRALELLFHLPLRLLGAGDGGLVLQGEQGDGPSLAASAGRGALLTVKLLNGAAPMLLTPPERPDLVTGPALGALRTEGVGQVARVPATIGSGAPVGCAYYFLPAELAVADSQMAALTALACQIGQVILDQAQTGKTASLYLQTLRSMVSAIDGGSSYTLGHSERIARYALMIARELGLPPGHQEAIALGGYLHDVGMIAIDTTAFLKEDRLTTAEYETVQEHTRIGAELVAAVPAALPLAPMVAHHHERWDGRGYPGHLRGKDIPLGARIIAVAELFEAKTTGRAYRRPLPFERALTDLQAQAGAQLDPGAVDAFLRAYQKARRTATPGRPLAPCYELREVPAEACGACANRRPGPVPVPCWENPGEACTRHGESCATCLVYTEAVSRSRAAAAEVPPKP